LFEALPSELFSLLSRVAMRACISSMNCCFLLLALGFVFFGDFVGYVNGLSGGPLPIAVVSVWVLVVFFHLFFMLGR
jgi:hypothetical protein